MTVKIHVIDEEGKYLETRTVESDKEATKAAHKPVYHFPDVKYTRIRPPREKENCNRYFVDGIWEYRKVLPEDNLN